MPEDYTSTDYDAHYGPRERGCDSAGSVAYHIAHGLQVSTEDLAVFRSWSCSVSRSLAILASVTSRG
jgi:hypothetical protein